MYVKFNNPRSQSAATTTGGRAVTILALGGLDHNKRLPGIGDPAQYHRLESGEVLLAPGDELQTFNPNKGTDETGIAILTLGRNESPCRAKP